MKAIKQTLLALALASTFTTANATPVDWTLSNVLFSNSNGIDISLSGSFTYDADTNSFSNFSVVAGAISAWALSYGDANSIQFYYTPYARTSAVIDFASALTNLGGNVELSSTSTYSIAGIINLQLISGTLSAPSTASAVPEPEVYAMMLAGLGLVGFAARRKLS